MPAYFYIAPAQLARCHGQVLARVWILDPQQILGQRLTKAAM